MPEPKDFTQTLLDAALLLRFARFTTQHSDEESTRVADALLAEYNRRMDEAEDTRMDPERLIQWIAEADNPMLRRLRKRAVFAYLCGDINPLRNLQ